jgi:hypothetical protein
MISDIPMLLRESQTNDRCDLNINLLKSERKVRTPKGSAGVNDPPSQDEEQWNRENVLVAVIRRAGTGAFRGANGVKAAKLCTEQDQIGEQLQGRLARSFRVRSLELVSNGEPRGMVVETESGLRSVSFRRTREGPGGNIWAFALLTKRYGLHCCPV